MAEMVSLSFLNFYGKGLALSCVAWWIEQELIERAKAMQCSTLKVTPLFSFRVRLNNRYVRFVIQFCLERKKVETFCCVRTQKKNIYMMWLTSCEHCLLLLAVYASQPRLFLEIWFSFQLKLFIIRFVTSLKACFNAQILNQRTCHSYFMLAAVQLI